jgi:hypothetical protein
LYTKEVIEKIKVLKPTCAWINKPEEPMTTDTTTTNALAATTAVSTITDPCYPMPDSLTCNANPDCSWYDPLNPPKPLFSEAFCHPDNANVNTPVADWDLCLKQGTACVTPCIMTTGQEMIPEHDYCITLFMTVET